MLSWHRFDLIDSTYALGLMADTTPAWRELYTDVLDRLLRRYVTFWGAADWLTLRGDDPDRDKYPESWKGAIVPERLWGRYNAPGWTGNGLEPWGLELDPIGAQGNLFYKGFFDLMLGTYRRISGEDTWNEPFRVIDEDGYGFIYTHDAVNDVLARQWGSRPEGCHCENTKIWPFCLAAAGLGLLGHDAARGTHSHWVFDQWWEVARQRYILFGDDGKPTSVALYYDPMIDERMAPWPRLPLDILGLAFYLAPQRREEARAIWRWVSSTLGWDDSGRELYTVRRAPRLIALGAALAREFGDQEVYDRLRGYADAQLEPSWTSSNEFSFWFGLDDGHPRGQPNATIMAAEASNGEGSWARLFQPVDDGRYGEPTVCGVDFPKLGVSQAEYDRERSRLIVSTYSARPGEASATSFRITKLQRPGNWRVRRDGRPYGRVCVYSDDTIEVTTDAAEHTYVFSEEIGG
jgi:hypothetical protein